MKKLCCTQCGYKFIPKKDKLPERCPYCATSGTLEPEKTAEDILRESNPRTE